MYTKKIFIKIRKTTLVSRLDHTKEWRNNMEIVKLILLKFTL